MTVITLIASLTFSFAAYYLTSSLIPRLSSTLISAGLKGKDLLKGNSTGGGGFPISNQSTISKSSSSPSSTLTSTSVSNLPSGSKPKVEASADDSCRSDQIQFIPESTGLIAGSIYVLVLCLFVPIPYYTHLLPNSFLPGSTAFSSTNNNNNNLLNSVNQIHNPQPIKPPFPHASLSANLASILSLLAAVFLGFLDDVFDIRWRFKLPIPIIASVPLLTAYGASSGSTDIIVPHIFGLRTLLGADSSNGLMSIGPLYYIYMSMLSTFCTNSINILAGINGVEVGQSIVICLSIITNDLLYIQLDLNDFGIDRQLSFGFSNRSKQLEDRHLFSLCMMMPLLAVMLALIKYNWYPAKTFVGDTFCYFAGMGFAVVGILGHFSKTLLLFFIPQIINFLYSSPQLFGMIPISRHRLPSRDPNTDKLKPSIVKFLIPLKRSSFKSELLTYLNQLNLIQIIKSTDNLSIIGCSNLTLLNLFLIWFPDLNERQLSILMLSFQVFCNFLLGFFIRYFLADLFYDSHLR